MSRRIDAVVVNTNTLHLVGLDHQGTIVLREKLARTCNARLTAEVCELD